MSENKTVTVKIQDHAFESLNSYWEQIKQVHEMQKMELKFNLVDIATSLVHEFFIHMSKGDITIKSGDTVLPPLPPAITEERLKEIAEPANEIEICEYIVEDYEQQLVPQLKPQLEAEGKFVVPSTSLMLSHAISYMIHYFSSEGRIPLSEPIKAFSPPEEQEDDGKDQSQT